jgi:hypothetical protein
MLEALKFNEAPARTIESEKNDFVFALDQMKRREDYGGTRRTRFTLSDDVYSHYRTRLK